MAPRETALVPYRDGAFLFLRGEVMTARLVIRTDYLTETAQFCSSRSRRSMIMCFEKLKEVYKDESL